MLIITLTVIYLLAGLFIVRYYNITGYMKQKVHNKVLKSTAKLFIWICWLPLMFIQTMFTDL